MSHLPIAIHCTVNLISDTGKSPLKGSMDIGTELSLPLQQLHGRVEYGVINVIGHRLGLKRQLENIQTAAIRTTIQVAILGQVDTESKAGRVGIDDIQASIILIRRIIIAQSNELYMKVLTEAGLIDSKTFQEQLQAAVADEELGQVILKILQGQRAEATNQEVCEIRNYM